MEREKVELLAPAGSIERLKMAYCMELMQYILEEEIIV